MADLVAQLRAAVEAGDAAAVEAALAAGASPNSILAGSGWTALHEACNRGHLACVRVLLAAGANPNAAGGQGCTPLHMACYQGHAQCIQALLAAGANPAAVTIISGYTTLTTAVASHRTNAVRDLLEAAPELALLRDKQGELPLQLALFHRYFDTARCLLQHGALPPAAEVLALLEAARQPVWEPFVLPLYAPLVARQPLTPAEWASVPTPCPGVGAALPAVLARSEAEAALLVARLPAADRAGLRTAALCLRRAHCWQRRRRVYLPGDVVRRVLALSAAE